MSATANSLPGQPHIAERDGALHVEGVALDALAREHGTPLFVYSQQWMLDALAAYQRGFEGRDAITTAAACLNWHAHKIGDSMCMRPGIEPPKSDS